MKKPTFKERFQYWFDNRMSNGSLGLKKVLAISTIVFVLLISLLIHICNFNDNSGFIASFWDSMITVINAWMPSFEDGGIGYLILMSVAAVVGLLLTSILIGIISSAIEEKVTNLKRGNSLVLEKDHIVILGFTIGEYTLINQLILSAGDSDCCILIASDNERDVLEQSIIENVSVPKNVKIICRTVDIFDPVSLQKCSLKTCRNIIISMADDKSTVKTLLAVSSIINSDDGIKARVGAILQKSEYTFPESIARRHNVVTLRTNETLAKIIAHSCTQPGLALVFKEIFNFEGQEFYPVSIPQTVGLSFNQVMNRLSRGIPIGIIRNGKTMINPESDMIINDGDKLIVFEENKTSAILGKENPVAPFSKGSDNFSAEREEVVVIGSNEMIDTLLIELPDTVSKVTLADFHNKYAGKLKKVERLRPGLEITKTDLSANNMDDLLNIVQEAKHVVVLCNHDSDGDDADMDNIFILLNLREFRIKYSLDFNVTVEMQNEANRRLVETDNDADYVVASDMSSLFLAQLSESPELYDLYKELLSNKGSEVFIKHSAACSCCGRHSVAEIRSILLRQHMIFLGYIYAKDKESHLNPDISEMICLENDDKVIVISEN